KLNFAGNQISISGKLYADLSQVTSGKVTVLFLADIPDQVQLLTIYGKLQMGFANASGDPVTFDVAQPPASPVAASTAPTLDGSPPAANGGAAAAAVANGQAADTTGAPVTDPSTGQRYIDITYTPATGANLNYGYIVSSSAAHISVSGLVDA